MKVSKNWKRGSSSVSMFPGQAPLCVFVLRGTGVQCTPPPPGVPAYLGDECGSVDGSFLVSTTVDRLSLSSGGPTVSRLLLCVGNQRLYCRQKNLPSLSHKCSITLLLP